MLVCSQVQGATVASLTKEVNTLKRQLKLVTSERDTLKNKKPTPASAKDTKELAQLRVDVVAYKAREDVLRQQVKELHDRLQAPPNAPVAPLGAPAIFAPAGYGGPAMFAAPGYSQNMQWQCQPPPGLAPGEKVFTYSEIERMRNMFRSNPPY